MKITVKTTCQATIEEEWSIDLDDVEGARIMASPERDYELLDCLQGAELISERTIGAEEDREVTHAVLTGEK